MERIVIDIGHRPFWFDVMFTIPHSVAEKALSISGYPLRVDKDGVLKHSFDGVIPIDVVIGRAVRPIAQPKIHSNNNPVRERSRHLCAEKYSQTSQVVVSSVRKLNVKPFDDGRRFSHLLGHINFIDLKVFLAVA
jgi:hypothetical protein